MAIGSVPHDWSHVLQRRWLVMACTGQPYGFLRNRKPYCDFIEASERDVGALAGRCRDLGLSPAMMFPAIHLDAHLHRIGQATAARIPFLLTFGKTSPEEQEVFIRNLKAMAANAQLAGVTVVVKQHGGN